MSGEEILIWNNGYTDTAYTTCGEFSCTEEVLLRLGVPQEVIETEGTDLSDFELDATTKVTVKSLPEGDSDAWCAAKGCGEFIRHGMNCECPVDEWDDQIDPVRSYPEGHVNLY